VPDLDLCFDMGECPLSAVPLDHVFLTHAHGDHSRCLLRHHALRGMFGIQRPATYYLPAELHAAFVDVAKAEARFESVPDEAFALPTLVPMHGDRALVPIAGKRDLFVSAFPVTHRVPSLGYTIIERRKRLKPALAGLPGEEIGRRRQRGEQVTDDADVPLLTFIGDCVGRSLREQDHIWKSAVVVIETTFLAPEDRARAAETGHTHVSELAEVLQDLGSAVAVEHIVLKHFSLKHAAMKNGRDEIVQLVHASIPSAWHGRLRLLV
jgi:ribonuclease Z